MLKITQIYTRLLHKTDSSSATICAMIHPIALVQPADTVTKDDKDSHTFLLDYPTRLL